MIWSCTRYGESKRVDKGLSLALLPRFFLGCQAAAPLGDLKVWSDRVLAFVIMIINMDESVDLKLEGRRRVPAAEDVTILKTFFIFVVFHLTFVSLKSVVLNRSLRYLS